MELDHLPTSDAQAGSGSSAPAEPQVQAQQKFVSFYLGDIQYALHSSAVAEVAVLSDATPLPVSHSRLVGIASLRGDIVAVVDLSGAEPRAVRSGPRPRSVVMRSADPHNEHSIAFNVDRVGEIVSIDLSDIKPAVFTDPLSTYETKVNGRPLRLIEASRIRSLLTGTQ